MTVTINDLIPAKDEVLQIILAQCRDRLAAQNEFATAQDGRASTIINAGVALGAAATAAVAAILSQESPSSTLMVPAFLASIGFTAAASLALWEFRSKVFHSSGFYPADFIDDIKADKSERDLLIDFILDLQYRLDENLKSLKSRQRISNLAALLVILTPLLSLVLGELINSL